MDVSRISYELRKHYSVLIISTIEPLEWAPGSSGIHPGLAVENPLFPVRLCQAFKVTL